MDRHERPHTVLTIASHRGLYLAIIMDRHEGPHTSLKIALHRGLYLAIIMDRHERPQSGLLYHFIEAFTYPLLWTVMKGPTLPIL
jgi:hypothetical protein